MKAPEEVIVLKSGEGEGCGRGRVEAEMRFKTYLNPPRRLETSLTTLSPLVISEGFFMPRQKEVIHSEFTNDLKQSSRQTAPAVSGEIFPY